MRPVLVAALFLILAACGGPAEPAAGPEGNKEENAAVSSDPKALVVLDYLNLKDALVEGNDEQALGHVNSLLTHLEGVPAYSALKDPATATLQAADLANRRKAFELLSDQLYPLLRTAKPEGMRLYRQFCPMAFDFKGAFWISAEREIMNPYFGDEMLHCGEVREIL